MKQTQKPKPKLRRLKPMVDKLGGAVDLEDVTARVKEADDLHQVYGNIWFFLYLIWMYVIFLFSTISIKECIYRYVHLIHIATLISS